MSLKVRGRRFLAGLQKFIYIQETLIHMLFAFYLHPPKPHDNSHLSFGQSTAMNPCAHSEFYRSAEAGQKEKVQVICYTT